MELSTLEIVKEKLLKENGEYRELVRKHQVYEERLTELAELTYPNDDELLEETNLKKMKLAIKDEMHSILEQNSSHQA